MIDAEVTRRGGGLQSRIQWVRLPLASLWIDSDKYPVEFHGPKVETAQGRPSGGVCESGLLASLDTAY